MEELTPDKVEEMDTDKFFDPYSKGVGFMTCCCGFKLYQETADTWRCEGGNHRYNVQDGAVVIDKFGNVCFKKPEASSGKNE